MWKLQFFVDLLSGMASLRDQLFKKALVNTIRSSLRAQRGNPAH
jgi:hypothetical protein